MRVVLPFRSTLFKSLPGRPAFLIALLCGLALSILDLLGGFGGADLKLLDWRFQIRGTRPVSDRVVLVVIDDATISAFDDRWPLPRNVPAAVIGALGEAGASAVGLDLLFLGPDSCDPNSDSLLVLATGNETGVVHAFAFPPEDPAGPVPAPSPKDSPLLRQGIENSTVEVARAGRVATPFPKLLAASPRLGHVSVAVDPDGVVRRIPLLLRYEDRIYPSLALSLFSAGMEKGRLPTVSPARGGLELSWGSGRSLYVPFDREGATAIDFAGDRSAFPHTYSMLQVLQWSKAGQLDSLREAFQGKIVLVGATSKGHVATDLGTTPYEAATPLFYTHANLLNALIQDHMLSEVPGVVRLLLLAAMSLFVGYFAMRASLLGALGIAAGTAVAFAIADYGLFLQGINLPPMAGLLLAPLVYTAVQSHRVLFVEGRERVRAKELAIAARIQKGLLPQARPRHPSLDVYGINVPAQEVGGDYYDWIATGDGELTIAVGDVEGKGIGAALLMAHLHTSFHAETRLHRSPREIVESMHLSLYQVAEARQFATFFLGVIDRDARVLRYCSGGHNPALLVRGNSAEWLEATGLPLGMILDGPPYEAREIQLTPGDVLVIYSDGITEYPFKEAMYGEERMAAAVVRLARAKTSATTIADGLLADIHAFAHGGPASDDVTLVVIRVTADLL
jgi:serine phosphatase RsbU (regulator of sigma subunit)